MTINRGRSGRRWRLLGLVVPVLSVLSVLLAPAAWAHSSLISSSPAADSVLAAPPTRIDLVFNEQIRDFQPRIAITVGDNDPVEVTPVIDGATVSADLTGMQWPTVAGTGSVAWKVGYRVVSADGHPVSGLVPFSVGDGPAPGADPTDTGNGEAAAAISPAATSATTSAPGPAAPPASSADQVPVGWWVAGAAVAVAALLAALVLLRRRRPGPVPSEAPDRGSGGN